VPGKTPLRRALSHSYTRIVNALSGHNIRYYNGLALHLRYNVMRWGPYSFGFGFQAELITRLLDEGCRLYRDSREGRASLEEGAELRAQLRNFLSVGHTLIEVLLRRYSQTSVPEVSS
jgi:hypothetical protein